VSLVKNVEPTGAPQTASAFDLSGIERVDVNDEFDLGDAAVEL
jgi:hypothetical protein